MFENENTRKSIKLWLSLLRKNTFGIIPSCCMSVDYCLMSSPNHSHWLLQIIDIWNKLSCPYTLIIYNPHTINKTTPDREQIIVN